MTQTRLPECGFASQLETSWAIHLLPLAMQRMSGILLLERADS